MRSNASTLQERVAEVFASRKTQHDDSRCFHCGRVTTLGRMSHARNGRRLVSCFRAECAEMLRKEVDRGLSE